MNTPIHGVVFSCYKVYADKALEINIKRKEVYKKWAEQMMKDNKGDLVDKKYLYEYPESLPDDTKV